MDEDQKPYCTDYAKSNRSKCKGCKSLISQGTLRIAHLVKSHFHDGMNQHWHHFSCFFGSYRPSSVDDIEKFHSLRVPDQEKIQKQIDKFKSGKSGKGSTKSLKDFVVQYALSSRSSCKLCDGKIEKDEIRISHKEISPDKPQLGLIDRWHHVGCFKKQRKELCWEDNFTADMMTGFKAIDAADRETLKKVLAPKGKKKKGKKAEIKTEEKCPEDEQLTKKLKQQSKALWKLRDEISQSGFTKSELSDILTFNKQHVPPGIDRILDSVADGMLFGTLPECPVCKDGQFVPSSNGGYTCIGNVSSWTGCSNTVRTLQRSPFKIPKYIKEQNIKPFSNYKYVPRERIFQARAAVKPLSKIKVLILGKHSVSKADMKSAIENLGGSTTTSLDKAYFIIATKDEIEKRPDKIESAELQNIFVVSEEILETLKFIDTKPPSLRPFFDKHRLSTWGKEDPSRKDIGLAAKRRMEMEEKSRSEGSKKMKMMVKHGAAVDPESGLEDKAHVITESGKKYAAALALVDTAKGLNSYYKLQLLKHDDRNKWYVWRSWGRVGTNVGGTKLESFHNKVNAIDNFINVYMEKTGNDFHSTNFVKQPKRFYPMDIDYGEEDEKVKSLQVAGAKSKLHSAVQDLMKMIFDIESMKKAMMEFELDLKKMPLGKLSRKQMQMAYAVLNEANELLETTDVKQRAIKITDCTNRFYTLLPHDFGMQQPPQLDNIDIIKSKIEMIESLMDIEIAYSLLTGEVKKEPGLNQEEDEDPLDVNYKKLQCDLEPLNKDTKEYSMIEKYVKNTHASTHSGYKLEIDQVFKVDRFGEKQRYRTFKKLHNRQLLWHGSRVTNYAGILSQGLRIAPPEAPVTGYMFGKGIYFADMVSKSANYCYASRTNPFGLALLSEVALGNMCELKDAENICKLPKGKHSVKGLGQTAPNLEDNFTLDDGTMVPLGKPCPTKVEDSSLLYNEYIVYDIAQVNVKYLLKLKFVYPSLW